MVHVARGLCSAYRRLVNVYHADTISNGLRLCCVQRGIVTLVGADDVHMSPAHDGRNLVMIFCLLRVLLRRGGSKGVGTL
jgi:hypothetical protein